MGYPKGGEGGVPQKETPTQGSEGAWYRFTRQDLVLSYSRNEVLSIKNDLPLPFLFLLLTYRYIKGIMSLWG